VSELLFQITTRSFDTGGSWRGNRKSWKTLINVVDTFINVVDVTGLDPISLVELGGGGQCFGEFCASGCVRTMKIGRRVRELHKLT